MKYDEFAFFNQQLAGMLRSGVPLEGALRQLCTDMRRGRLRRELEALEADLVKGVALDAALAPRNLPSLYVQMLKVGVKGDNLPGVLLMMADHYRRLNSIRTRLTGVLVYPAIVIVFALAVSIGSVVILGPIAREFDKDMPYAWQEAPSFGLTGRLLIVPVVLAAVAAALIATVATPGLRRFISWRLPPFRDAKLAQTASSMAIMLRGRSTLGDAVAVLRSMEPEPVLAAEFGYWQEFIAGGHTRLWDIAAGGSVFPPLFRWLVQSSGEDLASGFEQAAQVYGERASRGVDMVLYGALPVSVLFIGFFVLFQVWMVMSSVLRMVEMIGR